MQQHCVPDSTLNKKHHSISHHRCREAVVVQTTQVAKEGTMRDLSDHTAPVTANMDAATAHIDSACHA